MIDKNGISINIKLSLDEAVHLVLLTRAVMNNDDFMTYPPRYRSNIIGIYNKALNSLPDSAKAQLP